MPHGVIQLLRRNKQPTNDDSLLNPARMLHKVPTESLAIQAITPSYRKNLYLYSSLTLSKTGIFLNLLYQNKKKKVGPVIAVTLTAQHTPTSMLCKGTSCVNMPLFTNQYMLL